MPKVLIGNVKPVKGKDYWTQEDINELCDTVIAKLDVANESTVYPGCYYRMAGEETEWVNAPMLPDVEYRTTERMGGKPVYTMYISTFGSLPDNQAKEIPMPIETATVIAIEGFAQAGRAHRSISSVGGEVYVTDDWTLCIETDWLASEYTAHIFIKYVKDQGGS